MTDDAQDILVVGDGEWTVDERDRSRLAFRQDAYEALLEMSRRPWSAVVLSAEQADLPGLCRASRRLQSEARLLCLCEPPAEPEIRRLTGDLIDDYYIAPPTRSEWREILGSSPRPDQPQAPPTGLDPGNVSTVLDALGSLHDIEECLARAVSERLGRKVAWFDRRPNDPPPLLAMDGEPPRALRASDGNVRPDADAAAEPWLEGMRRLMPALEAASARMEKLHRLAITDHLTGAYNRRYFYHVTDQILSRAEGPDFRVTLLLYDIDNFKQYNDLYGHAAGDQILRDTAALMQRITRAQDVIARIGGDEFAVLFWDNEPPRSPGSRPLATAYDLADRFRREVAKLRYEWLGPRARGTLTISGGLANFPKDGQTCRDLLRSADRALRDAKDAGKNGIAIVGA